MKAAPDCDQEDCEMEAAYLCGDCGMHVCSEHFHLADGSCPLCHEGDLEDL